jgi:hypothetical protein
VGLSIFVFAAIARGGEYSDPSGYSFNYPDDWVIVTQASLVGDPSIPPHIKDLVAKLAKNFPDPSNFSAALLHRSPNEFHRESVTIVIQPQEMLLSPKSADELVVTIREQCPTRGISMTELQSHFQMIGGNYALVVECDARVPAAPFPLRYRQVYIPKGGKTYIITCAAKADSFATYSPTFDAMLASFKVPGAWALEFSGWIWIAVAVAGGLWALFGKLNTPRRITGPPTEQPAGQGWHTY